MKSVFLKELDLLLFFGSLISALLSEIYFLIGPARQMYKQVLSSDSLYEKLL